MTLPSRCQPIAIFSLVASAWKSTMMTRVLARIASISLQDHRERIVDRRHEDAAHHVDDADRAAVARLRDDTSRGPARRRGSWPAAAGAARSRCTRATSCLSQM